MLYGSVFLAMGCFTLPLLGSLFLSISGFVILLTIAIGICSKCVLALPISILSIPTVAGLEQYGGNRLGAHCRCNFLETRRLHRFACLRTPAGPVLLDIVNVCIFLLVDGTM